MSTLREIQLFELQMLKDLAKVCDDNNIKYMLSSGTLLGAVRHKGFIPWDDDIDVYMPLKDYKKFIKIGQKLLGDKYFVQNYRTEKYYKEMWTQIRANGTTSMPKKLMNWDIHFGMCIDIFPLVGCSNLVKEQQKQKNALNLNRTLLSDKFMVASGEPITIKQKLIYMIPRFIRRFVCKINERRYMLDLEKYPNASIIWHCIPIVYPKEIFLEMTKIKFEDEEFTTIKNYHDYLSLLYGDYMKLPDEDKRGGHDLALGEIIIDVNKDYKEYRKANYEKV